MMSLPPEMQMEMAKQLEISKTSDLSQVGTTHLETMFFEYIAKAQAENRFDQVADQLINQISSLPQFQSRFASIPEAKKAELTGMLRAGLLGELQLRKLFGKELSTDIWSTIARNIKLKMDNFTHWLQINVIQKNQKIASLPGTQVVGTSSMEF